VVDPKVPVEVPPLLLKTTVSPPEGMLLPAASFACKVAVMPEPEETEEDERLISEFAREIDPGVTVIPGFTVEIGVPLTEAPTEVTEPAKIPVNEAV
jgi:hypothetical protein